jgi:formate-dependent nitrite reductase membrane component NrfD
LHSSEKPLNAFQITLIAARIVKNKTAACGKGFSGLSPAILKRLLLRRKALHHNKPLTAVTALLILTGGYLLRYIFVYAGQMSSF